MRFIFYFLLISVGLISSALILAPSFFDINNYKSKIIQIVNKRSNLQLNINGDLKLSLFPMIKISIEEASISKKNIPQLFYSKNIFIYPSIYSLVKGKLLFKKIKFDNATLNIVNDENKKSNWQLAFEKDNKNNKKKTIDEEENQDEKIKIHENNPKNNIFLAINTLVIQNSKIIYDNDNKKTVISKFDASLLQNKSKEYELVGDFLYQNKNMNYKYNVKNIKGNYVVQGFLYLNQAYIKKSIEINIDNKKLQGNISLKSNDLNLLINSSVLKPIKIDLATDFYVNNSEFHLTNISARLNNNKLNGKIEYINKYNQKIANILLQSNEININNFIKEGTNKSQNNKKKNNEDDMQNEKVSNKNKVINFSTTYKNYLKNLNTNKIQAKIDLNNIVYNKFNIEDLEIKLDSEKNKIMEFSFKNLFKGNLKGNVRVDKRDNLYVDLSGDNINLNDLLRIYNINNLKGNLSVKNKYKLNIKNKTNVLQDLTGESFFNLNNVELVGVNFQHLKKNIKNLKNINDINNLKNSFLSGNTYIPNQKIDFKYKNGVFYVPITEIQLGEDNYLLEGSHNIIENNLDFNIKYNKPEFNLLSLFNIKLSGKINNVNTELNYDLDNLGVVLKDLAKSKLKKKIEKKLEKKFDNIMNNLLN